MFSIVRVSSTRRAPLGRWLAGLLGACALGLALTGCSTGSSTTSQSLVKSINAYVPAPGVDGSLTLFANTIYLTGGNIHFGQVGNSGGYISLTSGTYNLAASGPGTSAFQLMNQTFNGNNAAYTVIAAGQAGQTGATMPQIILMPNYAANQLALASGQAAIRIVNVSLNANPVGLFKTASGTPTMAVAPSTASLGFGYAAGTNAYAAIPTSSLTNMALVDTSAPATALALSSTSNLNTFGFTAGDAYTLVIYGQPGNAAQPFGCTWVQDYPAP